MIEVAEVKPGDRSSKCAGSGYTAAVMSRIATRLCDRARPASRAVTKAQLDIVVSPASESLFGGLSERRMAEPRPSTQSSWRRAGPKSHVR